MFVLVRADARPAVRRRDALAAGRRSCCCSWPAACRSLCRPFRGRRLRAIRVVLGSVGGDRPLKTGAYFATGVHGRGRRVARGLSGPRQRFSTDPSEGAIRAIATGRERDRLGSTSAHRAAIARRSREQQSRPPTDDRAVRPAWRWRSKLGYQIDTLTALMFAMVTFIGTCIFIFSLGYMRDETQEMVEDHEVDCSGRTRAGSMRTATRWRTEDPACPLTDRALTHFTRRGRFGRFFMYLSLFCFSMLNLVLADNLFQVFVSWELVGVCSFLLIGFYYERPSASNAANKAFIINRVGDAGFIVGLLIALDLRRHVQLRGDLPPRPRRRTRLARPARTGRPHRARAIAG